MNQPEERILIVEVNLTRRVVVPLTWALLAAAIIS
jgi:hypothetical protein